MQEYDLLKIYNSTIFRKVTFSIGIALALIFLFQAIQYGINFKAENDISVNYGQLAVWIFFHGWSPAWVSLALILTKRWNKMWVQLAWLYFVVWAVIIYLNVDFTITREESLSLLPWGVFTSLVTIGVIVYLFSLGGKKQTAK